MSEEGFDHDWKLKLRYGKLHTLFKHFTCLGEGRAGGVPPEFDCPAGPAWMAIKTWAGSEEESADMLRVIGEELGFTLTGDVHVFETEPEVPPKAQPYGYDINFTPFSE